MAFGSKSNADRLNVFKVRTTHLLTYLLKKVHLALVDEGDGLRNDWSTCVYSPLIPSLAFRNRELLLMRLGRQSIRGRKSCCGSRMRNRGWNESWQAGKSPLRGCFHLLEKSKVLRESVRLCVKTVLDLSSSLLATFSASVEGQTRWW